MSVSDAAPPSMLPWQQVLGNLQFTLNFDGSTAQPQYFSCFARFHNLASLQPRGPEPTRIVAIECTAEVHATDPSVNTVGFLAGAVVYVPASTGSEGAFARGTAIPSLLTGVDAPVLPMDAAEWYEPISLPIGGVNYPIWTQGIIDPLTTYVTGDLSGPGVPFFEALVQVNGSLTVDNAAQVTMSQRWVE